MAGKRSTTERGYGSDHQALRKQWTRKVRAGGINCWRCNEPIQPDEPWDLGHDDDDRSIHRGPEHRRCNRGTAGRRGADLTNAKRAMTTREW